MRSGEQRQRPLRSPQWPQGHARVAFLPNVPVRLKCLRLKATRPEPRTIGERLKACRDERQLTQQRAAELLGVTSWTIFNWENGRTKPPVKAMPALIRFLGYEPFPPARSLAERLLAKRRVMGWSISQAAGEIGVDSGTWRHWERGGVILRRTHRMALARLLALADDEVDREMRGRWIRSHGEADEATAGE